MTVVNGTRLAPIQTGQAMRSLAGAVAVEDVTTAFYRDAMAALLAAGEPFLVGGSHALVHYTGIARHTKDFDIFVHRSRIERVLDVLSSIGCHTEIPFPHWLAKAHRGEDLIDVIYSSGNGVAEVDPLWFAHAPETDILGLKVRLCPAEEMIWSKAFILERERFDGADVAHIILKRGPEMDWTRLLGRFGRHWRVLLAHLVLFGFIYPGERSCVPPAVMRLLIQRLRRECGRPEERTPLTQGTLLSREQYLTDLAEGYADGRRQPDVHMTPEEIGIWTRAISEEKKGQ
jgi:hypothetical protein